MKSKSARTLAREAAREAVFKIVFARLFTKEEDEDFKIETYRKAALEPSEAEYADRLLGLVFSHYEELCGEIGELAKGFRPERIFAADKSALLIAMAEIRYFDDIPAPVSIDEAVGLVRKYSAESSLAFVNGILASYYKKINGENQ